MINRHSLLLKTAYIGLAIAFLFGNSQAHGAASKRILFVGNSHTYSHDLPRMFAKLAELGGHKVEVDMVAPGGWTLSRHAASAETLNKIAGQKWDFVILQEQSLIPSIANKRKRYMYPAIRSLDRKIKKSGAKTILFMTWGYQEGFPEAGFRGFDEMQVQLHAGYMEIANEIEAMVAPVGIAWQNALKKKPQLDIWEGDGLHPDIKGSYLAACVFYAVIFQESPKGLEYEDSWLDKDTVQFLEDVATKTVLKKPEQWNIP